MNMLENQVLERLRVLSGEKQQEVLDFVEFLILRATSQHEATPVQQPTGVSFAQAAHQYIDVAEGPEDLSTFGEAD